MPNWTTNFVHLKGSEQDIQSIKNLIFSVDEEGNRFFDFNNVIPMPEEYNDTDQWYDWRVDNWGTKWNSDSTQIERDTPTELGLVFLTAWSHPVGVLSKLNDMFKQVEMLHEAQHEGGFGGHIAVFDPTENQWSLVHTTEVMIGENENGDEVELHEDEDGEYVDDDGNIYDDWTYKFVPVP